MAVVSIILGLISVGLAFFPPLSLIGLGTGILGIVLGVISRRNDPGSAGTGGLIISIIGTVLTCILFTACFACFLFGPARMMSESFKNPGISQPSDEFSRKMKELEQKTQKNRPR